MQRSLAWTAGARPIAPADLHLTLAFIGTVPADSLDHVRAAATVRSDGVMMQLDQLDVWKGGVVVLRPSAVPAELVDLQARIAGSLQVASVPFDARPFAPHVTLGRRAKGLTAVDLAPIAWQSKGHVLAASAGGRYRTVTRFGQFDLHDACLHASGPREIPCVICCAHRDHSRQALCCSRPRWLPREANTGNWIELLQSF